MTGADLLSGRSATQPGGGQLYLCGYCANQLAPALSAPGWAIRPAAVPLLAAAFIAGAGWRALTTAMIRTKMGAGLVILLGPPAAAVLLAWALARSISLARVASPPAVRGPGAGTVVLTIKGQVRELRIEARVSLLDTLREHREAVVLR